MRDATNIDSTKVDLINTSTEADKSTKKNIILNKGK